MAGWPLPVKGLHRRAAAPNVIRTRDGGGVLKRLARQWESPPTWLMLFLAAAWGMGQAGPVLPTGAFWNAPGIVLILAGLSLMIWAAWQFLRKRTTIIPREVPAALVLTGPYRFSRNPIYLADAFILTGAALIWDAGALILVPVFMAVITRRFILGEEAGLKAAFGAEFDAWRSSTRRWI